MGIIETAVLDWISEAAPVATLKHELADGRIASKVTSRPFTHVTSSTGHASEPLAGHDKRRVVSWHTSHAQASRRGREMERGGWGGVLVEPVNAPLGSAPAPTDPDAPAGITPPAGEDARTGTQSFREGPSDPADAGDGSAVTESAQTAALAVTKHPKGKGGTNWITKSAPGNKGELPPYIQNVVAAMERDGMDSDKAYEIGVGRVKGWAGGEGNVKPEVRAAAAAAVADMQAKKAKNVRKVVEGELSRVLEGVFDEALHPREHGEFMSKGGIDYVKVRNRLGTVRSGSTVKLPNGVEIDKHSGDHFTVRHPDKMTTEFKGETAGGSAVDLAASHASDPAKPASKFKITNAGSMSADAKIAAYEKMHGKPPSAAQIKKLRGIRESENDMREHVEEAIIAALDADMVEEADGGKSTAKVFCVKDRKKVTPTEDGKCPDCGMKLPTSKVSEAVTEALDEALQT